MTSTDKEYLKIAFIIIGLIAFIIYRQYNPLPIEPTYEPCSYQNTNEWLSEDDYAQCLEDNEPDIDYGEYGSPG